MKQERRRAEGRRPKYNFCDYRELLSFEKERSERHNHYFAICGLLITGLCEGDLVGLVQSHLRASDYVFTAKDLSGANLLSSNIGVLMPETNRRGAQVVKSRLAQFCQIREFKTQIGLAVYPDDGTHPEELLMVAFPNTPGEGSWQGARRTF